MEQADSVAPPRALGDHDSLSNKQDILFLSWKFNLGGGGAFLSSLHLSI